MSTLKNAVCLNSVGIDKRIQQKLIIKATAEIGERVRKLFTLTTKVVADQLEHDNVTIITCNCVFTNSDEVAFILDSCEMGLNVHFCVYPFHKWAALNDIKILVCLIEELVHFFWSIEDEYQASVKVHEIIKRIDQNVEITDLYSKKWLDANKPNQ